MKRLILFILCLCTLQSIYAVDVDYDYKLYVEKKLAEDTEYECTYVVDGKERDFSMRYGNQRTKILEGRLDTDISLDCTTNIDKITLGIYRDDVLLVREIKTKSNVYHYNLDYDIYSVVIEGDNIECEVNANGIVEEYRIEERLRIEDTYYNKFLIECDENMSEVSVTTYDKDYNEFYYNEFKERKSLLTENDRYLSTEYYLDVYVYDNLDEHILCKLMLDKNTYTYGFDEDVKLKDRVMSGKVSNDIKLSCDKSIDKITLIINNVRVNKDMFVKEYADTSYIIIDIDTLDISLADILNRTSKPVKELIVKKEIIINDTEQPLESIVEEISPIVTDKTTVSNKTTIIGTAPSVDTVMGNNIVIPVKEEPVEKEVGIFRRLLMMFAFW